MAAAECSVEPGEATVATLERFAVCKPVELQWLDLRNLEGLAVLTQVELMWLKWRALERLEV